MAHLIDKDALVAEINRQHKILMQTDHTYGAQFVLGFRQACRQIIDFLDTLEVKEVDLDDVIENYIYENFGERWDGCVPVGCFELDSMAEHFYMLGFNARK